MATVDSELAVQQVDYLFEKSVVEVIAGGCAAILLAGIAWIVVTPSFALCWLVAIATVYAARYVVTRRYRDTPTPETRRWHSLFLAGTSATALAWGVLGVALAIPVMSLVAGFGLFWIVCIAAATVVMYAGLYSAVLTFTLPALLPAGTYLLAANSHTGNLTGLMLCTAAVLLPLAAVRIRRLLVAGLTLERTLENLKAEYSVSRGEMERLQLALKSNANRREHAEAKLKQTCADLAVVKTQAEELEQTVERVSPLCPITDLANRKTFEQSLNDEWRRARRSKTSVSLLFVDVDDLLQHEGTDSVLKRTAKLLKKFGRRPGDLAAHFDNGRFAVVLPGSDARNTARMAEALRRRVEFDEIPSQVTHCRLQVSIGTATMVPVAGREAQQLQEYAQSALEEAHAQGGNTVVPYRSIGNLRIDRWNKHDDGPLTEQNMLQKLYVLGFKGARQVNTPGANLPDQAYDEEAVKALLSGQLRLVIEGEELVLKEGDCLFIPSGTTCSTEVLGQQPVINYQAQRA